MACLEMLPFSCSFFLDPSIQIAIAVGKNTFKSCCNSNLETN